MSKVYAAGSTEELLAQLRYASIGEGDILKQYGVTSIAPQMTVCGKAADTIEECMRMLLERDKRIVELETKIRQVTEERDSFQRVGIAATGDFMKEQDRNAKLREAVKPLIENYGYVSLMDDSERLNDPDIMRVTALITPADTTPGPAPESSQEAPEKT